MSARTTCCVVLLALELAFAKTVVELDAKVDKRIEGGRPHDSEQKVLDVLLEAFVEIVDAGEVVQVEYHDRAECGS